jgi:hypothetical protein
MQTIDVTGKRGVKGGRHHAQNCCMKLFGKKYFFPTTEACEMCSEKLIATEPLISDPLKFYPKINK